MAYKVWKDSEVAQINRQVFEAINASKDLRVREVRLVLASFCENFLSGNMGEAKKIKKELQKWGLHTRSNKRLIRLAEICKAN